MSALDPKQRELLLQIAQCELADDTLDDLLSDAPSLDSPCAGICDYQIQQSVEAGHSRDEYTKTMFHVPEPWNGNLETAEILFVSSNPSFLTTGEVAGMLGIARQTVWHRVQTGALVPVTKLTGNRGFLFNQSEIEAMAAKEALK